MLSKDVGLVVIPLPPLNAFIPKFIPTSGSQRLLKNWELVYDQQWGLTRKCWNR